MKLPNASTSKILIGIGVGTAGFCASTSAYAFLHVDQPEKLSKPKTIGVGFIGAALSYSSVIFAWKTGKICAPLVANSIKNSVNSFLNRKP
jgi:hypothetical protein